jgi:DNA-binding CsgD family transcriptional regulator
MDPRIAMRGLGLIGAGERAAAVGGELQVQLPSSLLQGELQRGAKGPAALSAREFEVFRLLAQGHSSAQCAQAMNLSPKTIANQQSLIKEKLGVATSAALAHLALRHRVIEAFGV